MFFQSFADLWVDFLLKETEREKRESADAANSSNPDRNSSSTATPPSSDHRGPTGTVSDISRPNQMHTYSRGSIFQRENSDSEFSTVPLTSSEGNSQGSRLPPRY